MPEVGHVVGGHAAHVDARLAGYKRNELAPGASQRGVQVKGHGPLPGVLWRGKRTRATPCGPLAENAVSHELADLLGRHAQQLREHVERVRPQ